MKLTVPFLEHASREAQDAALTGIVADAISEAVARRGAACLAVSGGRTPIGFFERLSKEELLWDRVWITLVDDRWLPADHADSNERLVREHLLRNRAVAARFVGLVNSSATPEDGLPAVLARWCALPEPIDVALLGVGEDGHTASLFPCARESQAAMDLESNVPLAAIHPVTAPYARISLTLPVLARSRKLVVQIAGEAKRQAYESALDEGTLPIARVLAAAGGHAETHWAP